MVEKLGNEENMDKVRQMMAGAEASRVGLGGSLTEGVLIDYTSDEGNSYIGRIVFKKPTTRDYMRMGAIKSEYLRQAGVRDMSLVDGSVKYMAHVMGTLAVVIQKCPVWLLDEKGNIDIENVKEVDLLFHVYGKYEEWENSFRKPVQGTSTGDSGTTEPAKAMETSEVLRESTAD